MDVAYDHIQEESLPEHKDPSNPTSTSSATNNETTNSGLNAEFQEAFRAVQSTPWGAKLGGFFATARKQTETLYTEAQKEYGNASEQAVKGWSELADGLRERTQGINFSTSEGTDDNGNVVSFGDPNFALPASPVKEGLWKGKGIEVREEKPESLPADIVKEASSMVSRLRLEAERRLGTVQHAEEAADEALLKFGHSVRDFLQNAVKITAPDDVEKDGVKSEVLFETNDAEGKRVFHSSRFEASLHAVHSNVDGFTTDPAGEEWEKWKSTFNTESETERIAKDLDKYEELRRAMEKLVPEKVTYDDFWRRYYFLRLAMEEEDKRRKEVLKGAAADNTEEVGWGDDDEEDESATPTVTSRDIIPASQSTTTLTPAKIELTPEKSPRPSHEDNKSTADSDASYDVVSGATSKTPSSPKVETKKAEESDEEDWE